MESENWSYADNDIFDDGSSDSEVGGSENADEDQPQHLNPSVVIIASPYDLDVSDDDEDDDDDDADHDDEDYNIDGSITNDSDDAGNETELGEDDAEAAEADDDDDDDDDYIRPRRYASVNVLEDNTNSSSNTVTSGGSTTVSATFSNFDINNEDMIVEAEYDIAEGHAVINENQPNTDSNSDGAILYISEGDEEENLVRTNQTEQMPPPHQHQTPNTANHSAISSVETDEPATPSRKRKRYSMNSPKTETPKIKSEKCDEDDEDDGLTCPICLDTWEMSGIHRLVALKCGHLFGYACIQRWLSESSRQSGAKLCPQCKTKASPRDIRPLYARRVRALDRTEEHNLRDLLETERKKYIILQNENVTMKMSAAIFKSRIEALEKQNEYMRSLINRQMTSINLKGGISHSQKSSIKIYLERTIEICREPGCRVMTFSGVNGTLFVSQKSGQKLFPGYGVRFIDTNDFRTKHYTHASSKLIRDICISSDERVLAVASMEPTSHVIDIRNGRSVSQVSLNNGSPLWSCEMDVCNEDNINLYLGAQNGVTYIYDIRKPTEILREYSKEGDNSPVIKIAQVPSNKSCPLGGFLVCTLRNLWFYKNETSEQPQVFRLNIEGPFISMNYNKETEMLLVTTRSNANYPNSRYLLGTLDKDGDTIFFNLKVVFYGAKITPIMTRSSQLVINSNTLVTGYVQDAKVLTLYDVRRETRLQSVPVNEVVFDTCPIYTPDSTFLAALTESKCRIYKLNGAE